MFVEINYYEQKNKNKSKLKEVRLKKNLNYVCVIYKRALAVYLSTKKNSKQVLFIVFE